MFPRPNHIKYSIICPSIHVQSGFRWFSGFGALIVISCCCERWQIKVRIAWYPWQLTSIPPNWTNLCASSCNLNVIPLCAITPVEDGLDPLISGSLTQYYVASLWHNGSAVSVRFSLSVWWLTAPFKINLTHTVTQILCEHLIFEIRK